MNLAVDIGNSVVHFGLFKGGKIIAYREDKIKNIVKISKCRKIIGVLIKKSKMKKESIEKCGICSVSDVDIKQFKKTLKSILKSKIIEINSRTKINMPVSYGNKRMLGIDRIMNSYAAKLKYGCPVVVVSFGTATVFDIVDKTGKYIGGTIAPGIKLQADSLSSKTALLPGVEIKKPGNIIAKNTKGCINSGIIFGTIAWTEYFIKKIGQMMKRKNITVVATGGFGSLIKANTKRINYLNHYLTLEGINFVLKNEKNI